MAGRAGAAQASAIVYGSISNFLTAGDGTTNARAPATG
jgi:hypothetical protein